MGFITRDTGYPPMVLHIKWHLVVSTTTISFSVLNKLG
uniref:Uncharacterized protein n=1 Tax=Arundo donax TaxID=35708 RepID=A0A0A8YQI7_ARUDO